MRDSKKRQHNQSHANHPKAALRRGNGLFQCATLSPSKGAHWAVPVRPSAEEASNAYGLARRSEESSVASGSGRGVWGEAPNHARALPSQIFSPKQRTLSSLSKPVAFSSPSRCSESFSKVLLITALLLMVCI